MSIAVLQGIASHLQVAPNLLAQYSVRYLRWTDAELKGNGGYCLLRLAGSGRSDYIVGKTDVIVRLIDDAAKAVDAVNAMTLIRQRFFERFSGAQAFHYQPLTELIGPTYLANDRAIVETTVRVMYGQIS